MTLRASRDVAGAIADLPADRRVVALRHLVDSAGRLGGIAKTAALQLNAEVVTLLREAAAVEFATTTLEHAS